MKKTPWDVVFERKDSKLSYDDEYDVEFLLKYKIKCENTKIIMKHRLGGEIFTHTESPVIDWLHGEISFIDKDIPKYECDVCTYIAAESKAKVMHLLSIDNRFYEKIQLSYDGCEIWPDDIIELVQEKDK